MQQIVKRCPQDGHEHDMHRIECEVCFGPLRCWCRECAVWLQGDSCPACLARATAAAAAMPPVQPSPAAPTGGTAMPVVAALICGVLSLMLSLCMCLGSLVGMVAVGLSIWAYYEMEAGRIDRRHLPLVIIGGLCGVLGILCNCGLSMLVFLSAMGE